jgi:hypothetical protein
MIVKIWKPLFSLVCVLGILSSSLASHDSKILVGLTPGASRSIGNAVRGIGRRVGLDPDSKLYIVALRKGEKEEEAIRALKSRIGVKTVLPYSSKFVEPSSYRSVDLHVQYLAAIEDSKPKADEESPSEKDRPTIKQDGGDFYDALRYYLQRRVAVGTDHVDFQALRVASDHVRSMPASSITGLAGLRPGMAPALASGGWGYLGPNNLAIPYQIYYGTPPLSGRISCIAYDPTDSNVIYAGSGGGGLWKTTNGGASWACVSDISPWKYPAVDCIAIDPSNHNTLYVGTGDFDGFFAGYNQGIMKSTDGGASWTNLAANVVGIYNLAVSHIVIDPTNDQIITCTTGRGSYGGPSEGTGNVYRSTNGGVSWTSAGLPATDWCALDVSAPGTNNVRTYWALGSSTVVGGTPTGNAFIYKSTNQGATWTQVDSSIFGTQTQWSLACSKVSANTIYFLPTLPIPSTGMNAVMKTTDGGASWINITAGMPPPTQSEDNWSQSSYDYFISTNKASQAPAGEVVFVGLITLAYSTNGGSSWVDYGQTYQNGALMHNDQHQFAVSASNGSEVLEGNDGGLFQLNFTWSGSTPSIALSSLNASLGVNQIYAIAPHPNNPNDFLAGCQDNACPAAIDSYSSWYNLGGGDGGFCGWDLPLNMLYVSSDGGSSGGAVYLYDLSGNYLNEITNGFTTAGFVAPLALSGNSDILYLGAGGLEFAELTSSNPTFIGGAQTLSSGLPNYVNAIGLSTSDSKRIYTAATDGEVWMSENGASSFTEIDAGVLPPAVGSALSVNPNSENDVLVGFDNTGIKHLWHTVNANASKPTWVSVSGSGSTALPDVPLNAIVRDPYAPSTTWYVGTDIGVFMTVNSGATWSNVNSNLPITQVFDLKYGNGYLYAGTFGRGAWRIQVPDPVATLALSDSSVPGGEDLTGTVTLAGPAPAIGSTVTLSSSSSVATVPSSLTFAAGATAKSFAIDTTKVANTTNVTITAASGSFTKTATLVVNVALASLSASPNPVVGGLNTIATVTLAGKTTTAVTVNLSSSSSYATVPATAVISANEASTNVVVKTSPVSAQANATITATFGSSSTTGSLTIRLPAITSFKLSPASIVGGGGTTATISLSYMAGPSGDHIGVVTSNADVIITKPVIVAKGETTYTFPLETRPVSKITTVTLTATLGASVYTTKLTINP